MKRYSLLALLFLSPNIALADATDDAQLGELDRVAVRRAEPRVEVKVVLVGGGQLDPAGLPERRRGGRGFVGRQRQIGIGLDGREATPAQIADDILDEVAGEAALLDGLDARLRTVVGEHMTSEVPLGAFLSGGIDSSCTAGLAVRAFGPKKVFGLLLPERDSSGASVRLGRQLAEHRGAQKAGREIMFDDYRLRVVSGIRDYGMFDRDQAPEDSKDMFDRAD